MSEYFEFGFDLAYWSEQPSQMSEIANDAPNNIPLEASSVALIGSDFNFNIGDELFQIQSAPGDTIGDTFRQDLVHESSVNEENSVIESTGANFSIEETATAYPVQNIGVDRTFDQINSVEVNQKRDNEKANESARKYRRRNKEKRDLMKLELDEKERLNEKLKEKISNKKYLIDEMNFYIYLGSESV